MKIIDKRTPTADTEFGKVSVGTVFECVLNGKVVLCLKIRPLSWVENTFCFDDGQNIGLGLTHKIHELNAHLVIEGRNKNVLLQIYK